ncbi:hypothetical protein [Coleofasciculus sp. FACHB-129]|uniref:hypothetical protein n=1 Tax=Cyanophyceae TaxID=3028117 RepID=UPI0016847013|nr:hypothetical protein [Coleofasciculus sp. FACHB-129]MBD1893397.1 hypothetical protein [Coleofasciculus sp. FACHB-129]
MRQSLVAGIDSTVCRSDFLQAFVALEGSSVKLTPKAFPFPVMLAQNPKGRDRLIAIAKYLFFS